AGPGRTKDLVQVGVADHLRERLALSTAGAHAEHRARTLVHQQDALVRVHRDDALHDAVENGRGLGALLLEVVDLLAQPRHHRVESAAQSADLIHGAHWRARRILALTHAPRDRFHLDDGPRDAAGDEEADTRRHGE